MMKNSPVIPQAEITETSPQYSIGDVSEKTGISAFTLRYYDKCGFFPGLYRGKNNVRSFSSRDIAGLYLVDALRKSGLSIEGIQYFVRLSLQGMKTEYERLEILQAQEIVLEYQRDEIEESLKTLRSERQELICRIKDAEIGNGSTNR